ncbi:YfbR-like 5'-deoxynucleotidase [Candidatus Hodarchaeum mangrovi]
MSFRNNLHLMKQLLRQGWIRAGVPLSSIESLADHSWSSAVISYILVQLENEFRKRNNFSLLNVEKAVCIALFHDFQESQYFDMDKSLENLVDSSLWGNIVTKINESAIDNLIEDIPKSVQNSIYKLMKDRKSEEYHIAKAADLLDLYFQAVEYFNRNWIVESQYKKFTKKTLSKLKGYEKQFPSIRELYDEPHD